MKISVINGSPKGEYSVTLQTVRYLEILHPEHEFTVLHAGQKIKSYEKDFAEAAAVIEAADLLLFSYPVYTFIAPYQLHKFIELMKTHGVNTAGKYATQLSTSKHFYDVTAHRYVEDNCKDLGLKYIRGLSADMDDLTTEKGQKEAESFFDYVCWSVECDAYEPLPVPAESPAHKPVTVPAVPDSVESCGSDTADKSGDVVIVADLREGDTQLDHMIRRFRDVLPRKSRVVNIAEYPFKGGCLGCFNCAVDGKCIYKDGFDAYLRNEIQTGEAIVYAFTIRDHSMGSRFKLYDDRQFCNGHRTVTLGMPMGYLVSGDYSKEFNLQMIIEGRAQVGGNILAGIATDETDPDAAIDRLAASLSYSLEHKNTGPQNFYGIGGMKIFRDLIYIMRGFMRADHKFFKSHGQYDFPQKQWPKSLAMYLVVAMIANSKIHSKMGNKMNEGMLMPYKKVLNELE
ncbi:MAG: NAD(P)H-dependent oxidoreductase [Firmicutes bacterium]|nr:NAD(P)H-dependent oxidoreductase [Bacillota bacterium]